MRPLFVRHVLGLHRGVADLPAETRLVHEFDAAVGSQRDDDRVDQRQHQHGEDDVASMRIVEVDARPLGARYAARCDSSTLLPDADRNQHQAEHEQRRNDQEENDADVGVGVEPEEIGEEDDKKEDRRQRHDDGAGNFQCFHIDIPDGANGTYFGGARRGRNRSGELIPERGGAQRSPKIFRGYCKVM